MAGRPGDEKSCTVCGRTMTWRRKWARNWDDVKYCSDACRKRGTSGVDAALEQAILDLLGARVRGATICPSEAARRVAPDDWRPLMERARSAARRLVVSGTLEMTQSGHAVDPSTARGPVRLRLLTNR
ncbi:MAG: DUF2256 and DUF3253 domain-containing protein [Pseudomonadota bacterium]